MKNFFLFVGSELVSSIGNGVYRIALNWTIVTRYRTVRALAIVQLLSLLCGVAVQTRSGDLIDRHSGRRVILATNLLLSGIAGILAIDAAIRPNGFSTGLGLVCVVVIGAIGASIEPAFFSSVVHVQGKPDNDSANAWILGSYALSGILGPIIGGVLTVVRGAWLGFAIDAVSFMIAAGLMALVTINQSTHSENITPATIQSPWKWTWQTPTLRRIFTMEAFSNLAVTPFIIGLPIIAKETHPTGGAVALGVFYAFFYGGVFASSAVVSRITGKIPRGMVSYIIPYGVAFGMFATLYSHITGILLSGLFIAGFGLPALDILTRGAVLETVPNHLLGRITAVGSVITTISRVAAMAVVTMLNTFHVIWLISMIAWLGVSTLLLFTRKTLPSGAAAF